MKNKKTLVKVYNKNFLVLENICCVDNTEKIMEQYDQIFVPTTVIKEITPTGRKSTTSASEPFYSAIDRLKKEGQFLPSTLLTFAIFKACFENKDKHPIIEKVVQQYKGNRSIYGAHIQNSLFDVRGGIVHYPDKNDSHVNNTWNIFLDGEFYNKESGSYDEESSRKKILSKREKASFNQPNKRLEYLHPIPPFDGNIYPYGLEKLMKEEGYNNFLINLFGARDFATVLNNATNYLRLKGEYYFYSHEKYKTPCYTGITFGGKYLGKFKVGTTGSFDGATTFRGVQISKP